MQRFFVQLPRQVHARFGRIDVLVQAQHHIVGDDGISGREKCHQALDQMPVRGVHAALQVTQIDLKVDFLDAPGILDRRAIHVVELGVSHRAQREIESRIEQAVHWQASQDCGFSREQAMASSVGTVVLAIRVAGRDRR